MWNQLQKLPVGKVLQQHREGAVAPRARPRSLSGLEGEARLRRCAKNTLKVIAKYVPIDADAVEIQIETRGRHGRS